MVSGLVPVKFAGGHARTRFTICEDGTIVAIQNLLNQRRDDALVHLDLTRLIVEHSVEQALFCLHIVPFAQSNFVTIAEHVDIVASLFVFVERSHANEHLNVLIRIASGLLVAVQLLFQVGIAVFGHFGYYLSVTGRMRNKNK